MKKRKHTIYIEERHDFFKDVSEKTKLFNYLLDKEFGSDFSNDADENDKIQIRKLLHARKILSTENPDK